MNTGNRKAVFYLMLAVVLCLVGSGVGMLVHTFSNYNALSMTQQDRKLQSMVNAADEDIAAQLSSMRDNLAYVVGRRGFAEAEKLWAENGEAENLIFRMQENLVTQNPMIHAMLAIRDGTILLSSNEQMDFTFAAGQEENLHPCFSGDGTMYLAVMHTTQYAEYAALIDMARWYSELARINAAEGNRLLLLGKQEKLLMHQWLGETYVTTVEELKPDNCDVQAVRCMIECRNSGEHLTATYPLTYPGDSFVHEMRMTVIPQEATVNGYFIVGLTSDYDEIILPMQKAVIRLIIYGGVVEAGILLAMLLMLSLFRRGRQQDRELESLRIKNEETSRLLEKTRELAHHQRLETIGTLTSSIAHEFNNLLTPIMGYAILTLEGLPEDEEELADNVTEIYEASRKAKTIISRLGELSRKPVEAAMRPVKLSVVVVKALQVAGPAQPAHVTTALDQDDEDVCINGDETQISQMLLNLILNAFHAMEAQGGTLKVSVRRDGERAVLTVADNGKGIPEAALPYVFEPFYTTKESGRGTGLGLAIVMQIVKTHGGEINVQSAEGKGTVFTVMLPAVNEERTADS